MTTPATIEDRGNGWWQATTTVLIDGRYQQRTFRWRTRRHTCDWLVLQIADGESVPAWYSGYELRGTVTQCAECGQTFEARIYEVTR